MSNKKVEVIVGVFILAILVILGWLTTQMGKFSFKKKPTYTLYAAFKNVNGLDVNTKVKVAGVDVGYIKNIGLRNGRAVVELEIYRQYKIPKDSIAIVTNKSLLGEKTLEIKYGHSNQYLQNGDFIAKTISPTDIGEMIANINKVFNQQNRDSIAKALKEIGNISSRLNEIVEENRQGIKQAIEHFNKSMRVLAEILKNNKQDVRTAVAEAREAMKKLNTTLENIYLMSANLKQGKGTLGKLLVDESLYNNVDNASVRAKSILTKIDTGKGTLGKLVNNDAAYNNLNETLKSIKQYLKRGDQIALNIYAANQHNFRDSYNKGIAYVDIYTMPDKFYRIGIVSQKDYEHNKHPKNTDTKTRFTAMMGKRYYDLVLRAGIEESRFGAGVDYYLLNDNLKASFDIFDFNHENDIRDEHAQAKFQLTYKWLRHFDLFAGVDEILNSKTRSAFVGAGVEFSSDDTKYLLTKMPSISPK